jgi:hypothetical protein
MKEGINNTSLKNIHAISGKYKFAFFTISLNSGADVNISKNIYKKLFGDDIYISKQIEEEFTKNGVTYVLNGASITLLSAFFSLGARSAHAVTGIRKNGQYYVYDSGTDKMIKSDWRTKEGLQKVLETLRPFYDSTVKFKSIKIDFTTSIDKSLLRPNRNFPPLLPNRNKNLLNRTNRNFPLRPNKNLLNRPNRNFPLLRPPRRLAPIIRG